MEENQEQHAIPQQISSYQFRLVGDMTLQQFFQVAAGAIIALILYSSTLPTYIKWPLILLSFLTGVAFAFFPLEDRPLQKWVILFFKSIYTPTLFVWRQDPDMPDYFQKEEITLPQDTGQTPIQKQQQTQPPPIPKPPVQTEAKKEESAPDIKIEPAAPEKKQEQTQHISIPKAEPKPDQKKNIEVPKTQQVEVEKTEKESSSEPVQTQQENIGSDITPIIGKRSDKKSTKAKFNQDAGPPTPPNKPNVVVGQVLGPDGEIVENAILEIKDTEGRPVRALKSNKLGHFMIVTPLSDGKYEIITEKEGLDFDTITFEAKGEIIRPIAVWANKAQGSTNQESKENVSQEETPSNQTEDREGTIYNQQQ